MENSKVNCKDFSESEVLILFIVTEVFKKTHPEFENFNQLSQDQKNNLATEFVRLFFKLVVFSYGIYGIRDNVKKIDPGNNTVEITVSFPLQIPNKETDSSDYLIPLLETIRTGFDVYIPKTEEINNFLEVLKTFGVVANYKMHEENSTFELTLYKREFMIFIDLFNQMLSSSRFQQTITEEILVFFKKLLDTYFNTLTDVLKEEEMFKKLRKTFGYTELKKINYFEEKGVGYLVFGTKKVLLGKINTKKCKLMKFLVSTPGRKSLDVAYDIIKTERNDEKLSGVYNTAEKLETKIRVIKDTIKDVHKSVSGKIGGIISAIKIDKNKTITIDEDKIFLKK